MLAHGLAHLGILAPGVPERERASGREKGREGRQRGGQGPDRGPGRGLERETAGPRSCLHCDCGVYALVPMPSPVTATWILAGSRGRTRTRPTISRQRMAASSAVRSCFYLSVTCSSFFHSPAFSLQPLHLACTLSSSPSMWLFVYVYMYGVLAAHDTAIHCLEQVGPAGQAMIGAQWTRTS